MAVDSYARQLAQIAMNKGGSGGSAYDDTEIKKDIADLQTTKLDIVQITEVSGEGFDLKQYQKPCLINLKVTTSSYFLYDSIRIEGLSNSSDNIRPSEGIYYWEGSDIYESKGTARLVQFYGKFVERINDTSYTTYGFENLIIRRDNGIAKFTVEETMVTNGLKPQTIYGVKTFSKLPQSSVTPTADNQFVNKKYVDDSISTAITGALGGSY